MHGFFLDETTLGYRLLWPVALLSIGITTASAWMLTGLLISGPRGLMPWAIFSAGVFAIYAGVVLYFSQQFSVVVLTYTPAIGALFFVTARKYFHTRAQHLLFSAGGIMVSLIAALLQYAGVAIHPEYFNHNSTYHLVQALGLWILFKGSRDQLTFEKGDK